MSEKIEALKHQFESEISTISTLEDLEELKVKYLGKKGPIQALMQEMRHLKPDERPAFGKLVNDLKVYAQNQLDQKIESEKQAALSHRLKQEAIDVTLPGKPINKGSTHPVLATLDETLHVLKSMGFSVQYGKEVESEYYNYSGLNYPEDHPARDMQDTYYITPELLLRSHNTAIQLQLMEKHAPPIRVVCPGKCYRNETISSRSHVLFHQFDVVYIDKGVTFADMLATQEEFYKRIFGSDTELRVRPSYFPFVEPGVEVDVKCTGCSGNGCPLCKHTGWLEVAGAGMVHPHIIANGGLDPEVYTGFAWGGGVERICMLKHGIKDIRQFTDSDLRFLKQFA